MNVNNELHVKHMIHLSLLSFSFTSQTETVNAMDFQNTTYVYYWLLLCLNYSIQFDTKTDANFLDLCQKWTTFLVLRIVFIMKYHRFDYRYIYEVYTKNSPFTNQIVL